MKKLSVSVAALLFVCAGTANAIVHPLGEASTAAFSIGSGTGETARGWDFLVNDPNISVVELGVSSAAANERVTLSLWDVASQTLLGQTTVTPTTANTWTFASLGLPVALTQGQVYSVVGWVDTTGGSPWYVFNNTPPAAFNPTGTIQYLNTRFDNGSGPNVFPGQTIGAPASYGVVDIGFVSQIIPEPATATLGLLAFGSMMLRRRRAA